MAAAPSTLAVGPRGPGLGAIVLIILIPNVSLVARTRRKTR